MSAPMTDLRLIHSVALDGADADNASETIGMHLATIVGGEHDGNVVLLIDKGSDFVNDAIALDCNTIVELIRGLMLAHAVMHGRVA